MPGLLAALLLAVGVMMALASTRPVDAPRGMVTADRV
jgi:hypothetical protein